MVFPANLTILQSTARQYVQSTQRTIRDNHRIMNSLPADINLVDVTHIRRHRLKSVNTRIEDSLGATVHIDAAYATGFQHRPAYLRTRTRHLNGIYRPGHSGTHGVFQ